jgi:hypothetical protein
MQFTHKKTKIFFDYQQNYPLQSPIMIAKGIITNTHAGKNPF